MAIIISILYLSNFHARSWTAALLGSEPGVVPHKLTMSRRVVVGRSFSWFLALVCSVAGPTTGRVIYTGPVCTSPARDHKRNSSYSTRHCRWHKLRDKVTHSHREPECHNSLQCSDSKDHDQRVTGQSIYDTRKLPTVC